MPISFLNSFASPVGIPLEFILLALTLLGVAVSHRHALKVASCGLFAIVAYRLNFTDFALIEHLGEEWVVLVNIFGLLTGFAVLADHFERSKLPLLLPRWLPSGWSGAFCLLVCVGVLSAFLDNIAAAMVGAMVARDLFRQRVHVGYLAAIVAASNAGGSGSVLGDTTTTMMWIAGVSPLCFLDAYVGSAVAILIFGAVGSWQQTKLSPIMDDPPANVQVDHGRLALVVVVLATLVLANLVVSAVAPEVGARLPILALALWTALGLTSLFRSIEWQLAKRAAYGSLFLLALVLCASLMPVHDLPQPSAASTLLLGFVSSLFDNIPLTKLALEQGGYDWGFLAYAVGVGGSMVWFGSSAGVAVASVFEEARSVTKWLRHGWHVPVAFVAGYAFMVVVLGWHPGR